MSDLKVKDHDNLVRDGNSGAVLSVDEEELMRYRARKLAALRERDREREFQNLKAEVADLKNILIQIHEKVMNG